jgi:ElaB/YqjD/DUF883 family membrane-anchored ribosome-binding protein
MAANKTNVDRIVDDLKQVRDELEVRIHLAGAEARDEWEALERKWQHLRGRAKRVGEAVEEAAEDVGEAFEVVADEVKTGYERIRQLL